MKRSHIDAMTRGWFVGAFSPTLFDTDACEVAYKKYKANDKEDRHYHKIATEITVVTKGKIKMNDEIFKEGDIVIVYPYEEVSFEAIEDSSNVVIKLPGTLNDKYLV